MAEDTYNFPEDEFDELGKDRTPQGVHRAPRPWWRVWGPLIAVVILAPILAIGLVKIATQDRTSTPEASQSTSQEAEETGDGTETATEAPTTEAPVTEEPPAEEPTPEAPPIDQSVTVSVLNGAGRQGLAGRVAETLTTAGWTSVEPGNYTSAQPQTSAVYYASADLAPAAQAVAETLGIATVQELGEVTSITVVLRSDFAE